MNRWFTKDGKTKRIPKKLNPLKEWSNENFGSLMQENMIRLTASLRKKYPELGLAKTVDLLVFLFGVYDNKQVLLTKTRYKAGEKIYDTINKESLQ